MSMQPIVGGQRPPFEVHVAMATLMLYAFSLLSLETDKWMFMQPMGAALRLLSGARFATGTNMSCVNFSP